MNEEKKGLSLLSSSFSSFFSNIQPLVIDYQLRTVQPQHPTPLRQDLEEELAEGHAPPLPARKVRNLLPIAP